MTTSITVITLFDHSDHLNVPLGSLLTHDP